MDQPPNREVSTAPAAPRTIPAVPPVSARRTASIRNCERMSRSRAPTAIRIPISRVRSVTDTSMMFMIPMPPTTSDTDAIPPSSRLMIRVADSARASISDRFRTLKSSSWPCPIRWRWRSSAVTWRSASWTLSPSTACTMMTPTVPACALAYSFFWSVVIGRTTASS